MIIDNNEMTLKIKSFSCNESFARTTVANFCVILNPTIEEISDIKTAVSECVTNCVVHAYPNIVGDIEIFVKLIGREVNIVIKDNGVGIKDIEKAKQPFYTTVQNGDRSGMGFTVMETLMDELYVESNQGVKVTMIKYLADEVMGE